MTRTVYLVIYNSPLFPAHWGLWLPSLTDPTLGKFLHAEGDAANGFEIVFKRNYDLDATSRPHQSLPLAEVSEDHAIDVPGDGSLVADSIAHDDLERVLLSVPAPGASLVSASSQVRKGPFVVAASFTNDLHSWRDRELGCRFRTVRRGYEMESQRWFRTGSWINRLCRLSMVHLGIRCKLG
ncbi:hypothetical protein J1614_009410 [Plenodomus biglobosus]|nr:hypothetical protein J1614_009410 [Plenodomus biglobosus]